MNIRSFGFNTFILYGNEFIVQDVCDRYNGDNGIVDVYTNNLAHKIYTEGEVYTKGHSVVNKMALEHNARKAIKMPS